MILKPHDQATLLDQYWWSPYESLKLLQGHDKTHYFPIEEKSQN